MNKPKILETLVYLEEAIVLICDTTAPIFSPIEEVTTSTTISEPTTGTVFMAHADSAITITLPAPIESYIAEIEIMNYGTADVTISGALHTDWSTAVASVILEAGNAVALKWVGPRSFWTIIGNYT